MELQQPMYCQASLDVQLQKVTKDKSFEQSNNILECEHISWYFA